MTDFIRENPNFDPALFNPNFGLMAQTFRNLKERLAQNAVEALWHIMQVSDKPLLHMLPLPLERIADVLLSGERGLGAKPRYLHVEGIVDQVVDLMFGYAQDADWTASQWRWMLVNRFFQLRPTRACVIVPHSADKVYGHIHLTGNMPVVFGKHGIHGNNCFVVLTQREKTSEDQIHLWCRPDFEQALALGVEVARVCHAARVSGHYKVPGGATRLPRGFDMIAGLLGNS